MSKELMDKSVEDMLRMSAAELKDILPLTLDEIRKYGVGKMLEEVPDLLSKIIARLVEIEAAKFISEVPEASDKLMDLLWEGVGKSAMKSEKMRSVLERAINMNVNLEASDSSLRGHFRISHQKLSGGSGLLHFKEQDFRFLGPTEVLMRLLNGDLALGFSNPKLLTEGHPGFAPLLGPIIQGISELIKGK